MDLTRTIQRKKEKELAALQFVGGESVRPRSSRCSRRRRSAATIPARAAAERSTKNAAERETRVRSQASGSLRLCCLRLLAHAAIFPDQIGDFEKGPLKTIAVPDQALYDEYGLEATEQADYTSPKRSILRRPPGAFTIPPAPWLCSRPAGRPEPRPPTVAKLAVQTSDGVIFAYGNYVFQFTGMFRPQSRLEPVYAQLAEAGESPLPALIDDSARRRVWSRTRNAISWVRFRWTGSSRGSRRRWRLFTWAPRRSLVSTRRPRVL